MVEQSLIEYVRRLKTQGYSSSTIRNQLINSGYAPFDIANVLKLVDKTSQGKKLNFLNNKILIIIFFLIIVSSSIYFIWPSSVNIIEFSTKLSNNKIEQGSNLLFFNNIRSDNKKEIFVNLDHNVLNSEGNSIITKKETVLFSEYISSPTDIALFSTISLGDYDIKTVLNYGKTNINSELSFSVIEKKDVEIITTSNGSLLISECPVVCNDFNSCTTDKCFNGNCVFELKNNCCGNNICETSESESSCSDDCKSKTTQTIDDLKQQAKDNLDKGAEKAAKYCNQIADLNLRNECFIDLSKESKDSIFCSSISNTELRDSCLIDIVLNKKDYSLCNKILDELLRDNCLLMSKVNDVNNI